MPIVDKIIRVSVRNKSVQEIFKDYTIEKEGKLRFIYISQYEYCKRYHSGKTDIECICDNCNTCFTRRSGCIIDIDKILCEKCQIKATNRERYGADAPMQNKQVYEKMKNTMLERYGVENSSYNKKSLEQRAKTNIERYGHSCAMNSPEIKKKIIENNIKKYGYECTLQNEEVKEKARKTILERYGVENVMQLDEIKEKAKKTMIERYGVENIMQLDEGKEKAKKTMIKHYGVENIMLLDEGKEKAKKTMIKHYGSLEKAKEIINKKREKTNLRRYGMTTPLYDPNNRCKWGKIGGRTPYSAKQKYIAELLSGELNYPCDKYALDIALVDKKINIEYDGGGHRLSIKFGKVTEEEFDKNEKLRDEMIINSGWKIIRINCPKDKLPKDEEILKQINNAVDKLQTSNEEIIYINW